MSTVEAEVIAAGASYFSIEKVLGPDGQPRKDRNGNEVISEIRHNAVMGQKVEMSEYEFQRLSELGAVRKPSDTPIGTSFPTATPFGVPLPDEDGNARAFPGPVMGDPSPTAGLTDLQLRAAAGALTAEQAAELARQAVEGVNDESKEAISDRDYEAASKSSLESEINRRNASRDADDQITVEGTGKNGAVVKDDLIMALEEDDENQDD